MTERKPSSVADGLTTVYFIVLSVWCFLNGYVVEWLIGMPVGISAYAIARWVWNTMERGK